MKIIKELGPYVYDENMEFHPSSTGKETPQDVEQIVSYLLSGVLWVGRASLKECEICDVVAGPHAFVTDGTWLWVKWLSHYVKVHNLELPIEFLSHIRCNGYEFDHVEAARIVRMPADEVKFV